MEVDIQQQRSKLCNLGVFWDCICLWNLIWHHLNANVLMKKIFFCFYRKLFEKKVNSLENIFKKFFSCFLTNFHTNISTIIILIGSFESNGWQLLINYSSCFEHKLLNAMNLFMSLTFNKKAKKLLKLPIHSEPRHVSINVFQKSTLEMRNISEEHHCFNWVLITLLLMLSYLMNIRRKHF